MSIFDYIAFISVIIGLSLLVSSLFFRFFKQRRLSSLFEFFGTFFLFVFSIRFVLNINHIRTWNLLNWSGFIFFSGMLFLLLLQLLSFMRHRK